jgi:hypothetical protein
MIYAVSVPYVTTYTYWVEANDKKEALEKVMRGTYTDMEETGENTGYCLWKKAEIQKDDDHTWRMEQD